MKSPWNSDRNQTQNQNQNEPRNHTQAPAQHQSPNHAQTKPGIDPAVLAFLGLEQPGERPGSGPVGPEDRGSGGLGITILPGRGKDGSPEGFERLDLLPGQVWSILGPTGSGKSRLLADIEWLAQGDTPTGRRILVQGEQPELSGRFNPAKKLVAQLSQTMNFVMDLGVGEFIQLHARSRNHPDPDGAARDVIAQANLLAGEGFGWDTPLTSLSGGQSRALMIADTALVSRSPIVLIDEIENAGIDRRRALELLTGRDKIVLMATHDPILALLSPRRIIIRQGGIAQVLETDREEQVLLERLEEIDAQFQNLRAALRRGDRVDRSLFREFAPYLEPAIPHTRSY